MKEDLEEVDPKEQLLMGALRSFTRIQDSPQQQPPRKRIHFKNYFSKSNNTLQLWQ